MAAGYEWCVTEFDLDDCWGWEMFNEVVRTEWID